MFDIPDEGADSYFGIALVETAYVEENLFYLIVFYDGHDGVVHLGPGVSATMGIAVARATSLYVLPEGETADVEHIEEVFHALGVGLIEDYHY